MEVIINLLIHFDPGARGGFLASWLTNRLTATHFDCGNALRPNYFKIHRLNNPSDIATFNGIKIRIKPSLEDIDLISLLFLRKNVHTQIPDFTRNEYILETFTKLIEFAKEVFSWDKLLDYSLYDYSISFDDTFNRTFLQDLYFAIHDKEPSDTSISIMEQTNKINSISIDKNHACSIMKMVLTRELELGLKEENRHWSIVDVYRNTPVDQLYDTVYASIKPENYGA